MRTGLQRLGHGDCLCAADIWTGTWPGETECREFGWVVGADFPDLNRLYAEAVWNPATQRWMRVVAERLDPARPTTGKDES
jgi:hypothetical protein